MLGRSEVMREEELVQQQHNVRVEIMADSGAKRKSGHKRQKHIQRSNKYVDEQKEMDDLIEKCSMEVRYRVWYPQILDITALMP